MEIVLLSLLTGSLGYEAIVVGNFLQQHQQQQSALEEEEETLTRYDSDEQSSQIQASQIQASQIQPVSAATSAHSSQLNSQVNELAVNGLNSTNAIMPEMQIPEMQDHAPAQPSADPRLMGWEFKIVRANRELFRDPAVFQRLCREESEAGWIMLEKLDDRRVRFKRPIALREILKSDYLPHDPYRTHYGSSVDLMSWLGLVAAVTAIVLPAYLGYALVFKITSKQPAPATFPSPTYPSPSLP